MGVDLAVSLYILKDLTFDIISPYDLKINKISKFY